MNRLADVQGVDDDHLFDDAPQGMVESSVSGSFARGAGLAPSPVERRIRGQSMAGGMTKSNLDTFVRSPQWFQIPDASKRDVIEHAFKANREGAANMVMARQPEIMANATARKTAHASGQDIRPIQ
jgi:hypothetical protein